MEKRKGRKNQKRVTPNTAHRHTHVRSLHIHMYVLIHSHTHTYNHTLTTCTHIPSHIRTLTPHTHAHALTHTHTPHTLTHFFHPAMLRMFEIPDGLCKRLKQQRVFGGKEVRFSNPVSTFLPS